MNNKQIILSSFIFILLILIIYILLLPYISKEKFNIKKNEDIKDFDKNVIELEKLKYDIPKIKDFIPKKTSELKLFCKQDLDTSKISCYEQ